jgi:hypothetical protein
LGSGDCFSLSDFPTFTPLVDRQGSPVAHSTL